MTREEAIRRIKAWNLDSDDMEVLSVVIPELTTYNERIIKSITRLVKAFYDCNFPTPEGFERKDLLVWLEKLGEQKYLYYDQGFVEGMRQANSLANAEIIVSPPKTTNKVSVSEELYEHIRETCACIDDAMSSKTLVDITEYLEMADKSAQAAFDMLEKQKEQPDIKEKTITIK